MDVLCGITSMRRADCFLLNSFRYSDAKVIAAMGT